MSLSEPVSPSESIPVSVPEMEREWQLASLVLELHTELETRVFCRPLPISCMYAKIPPAKKKITAARAKSAGGDNAIFGSLSLGFWSGIS